MTTTSDGGRVATVEAEIQKRNARRDGAEVRFTCPNAERHQNGDAHPSARWHRTKHVWRCDVCVLGGGWMDLERRLGLTPEPHSKGVGRIVATYDYRDEHGTLLFQQVRFRPKNFRLRRPRGAGLPGAAIGCSQHNWSWKLNGARLVLYRLPELLDADPTSTVCVCEGEKDADALAKLGLIATTNPMGVGKWRGDYNKVLSGRHVVILPDNDKPGREHAERVARGLKDIAASIKIINLPNLAEKGDVSDWLAAGGTREQIEALVADAPQWIASDDSADDDAKAGDTKACGRDGREPALAARLVTLVGEANAELFHTADGQSFATIIINHHNETFALRSRAFRSWMERLFYERTGKAPTGQVIQAALGVLDGRARFDGVEHAVYTRLAERDGTIYLDLADADWTAVATTSTGWQALGNPPVKFRRARGMLALPQPIGGASIEVLRQFVNVRDEADFVLLVAWLVAALRPRGPYPALALHGEQGSAKSTTARVLRMLVDPNVAALRAAPREPRDLMIAATNGWCVAFDNLSHLPSWLSDALCRLATGGGFATRELYSDAEEILFNVIRPILVNGIEELTTRGDLLDRAIVLELPEIADEERRPEAEFWRDFEAVRPLILGALLDAVAGALRELPRTTLARLPRMADFALWTTAAERALGWESGAVVKAYTNNRAAANTVTLEASPTAEAVLELLGHSDPWTGTAAELLKTLTDRVPERIARSRGWPKSARALSGALRRLIPNLRAVGVHVESSRSADRKRTRTISIRTQREGKFASTPSAPSAELKNAGFSADGADANADGADANWTQAQAPETAAKAGGWTQADGADAKIPHPAAHSETCECDQCLPPSVSEVDL